MLGELLPCMLSARLWMGCCGRFLAVRALNARCSHAVGTDTLKRLLAPVHGIYTVTLVDESRLCCSLSNYPSIND